MRAKPRQRPQTASIEHLTQRLGEVRKKAALSAISSPQLVTARDVQEAGAEALALARDLQLQASRVNRGREREVRGDLAKLCRVYNDEKRRADEKEKAVALLASELRIGETALQRMLAARADASLQPLVRAEHLEGECARVEEKLADLEEYAPRNSGAILRNSLRHACRRYRYGETLEHMHDRLRAASDNNKAAARAQQLRAQRVAREATEAAQYEATLLEGARDASLRRDRVYEFVTEKQRVHAEQLGQRRALLQNMEEDVDGFGRRQERRRDIAAAARGDLSRAEEQQLLRRSAMQGIERVALAEQKTHNARAFYLAPGAAAAATGDDDDTMPPLDTDPPPPPSPPTAEEAAGRSLPTACSTSATPWRRRRHRRAPSCRRRRCRRLQTGRRSLPAARRRLPAARRRGGAVGALSNRQECAFVRLMQVLHSRTVNDRPRDAESVLHALGHQEVQGTELTHESESLQKRHEGLAAERAALAAQQQSVADTAPKPLPRKAAIEDSGESEALRRAEARARRSSRLLGDRRKWAVDAHHSLSELLSNVHKRLPPTLAQEAREEAARARRKLAQTEAAAIAADDDAAAAADGAADAEAPEAAASATALPSSAAARTTAELVGGAILRLLAHTAPPPSPGATSPAVDAAAESPAEARPVTPSTPLSGVIRPRSAPQLQAYSEVEGIGASFFAVSPFNDRVSRGASDDDDDDDARRIRTAPRPTSAAVRGRGAAGGRERAAAASAFQRREDEEEWQKQDRVAQRDASLALARGGDAAARKRAKAEGRRVRRRWTGESRGPGASAS